MRRIGVLFVLGALVMVSLSQGIWLSRIAVPVYWKVVTRGYKIDYGSAYDLRVSPGLDGAGLVEEVEAGMKYLEELDGYFQCNLDPPLLILMSSEELNHQLGGGYSLKSAGAYQSGVVFLGVGEDSGNIRQTLVHELTHHYVENIGQGNSPIWYGEGLAQLIEGKFLGRLWFDGNIYNDYYKYSTSELTKDFYALPDQVSAYRLALELAKAIEETGGGQAHLRILKDLKGGVSFSEALKAHAGMNLESLHSYVLGQNKYEGEFYND